LFPKKSWTTIISTDISGTFQSKRNTAGKLDLFKNSINQHINQKTQDEIFNWAEKQSYIVLANLMYAAAIENIDTCPMEGFRQELIEEILEINPETEKVTVTLALGYRSEEDHFQHMKKVRKPNEKLFKFI
jgi:nitroreductase